MSLASMSSRYQAILTVSQAGLQPCLPDPLSPKNFLDDANINISKMARDAACKEKKIVEAEAQKVLVQAAAEHMEQEGQAGPSNTTCPAAPSKKTPQKAAPKKAAPSKQPFSRQPLPADLAARPRHVRLRHLHVRPAAQRLRLAAAL